MATSSDHPTRSGQLSSSPRIAPIAAQGAYLPRLMVICDHPIAQGFLGNSEALFRLLQAYPADKLIVVQTSGSHPDPALQVECRNYSLALSPWARLTTTRLAPITKVLNATHYIWNQRTLAQLAREHRPQAVLTLASGAGWIAARRIANRLKLPLHLLVHDGPAHMGIGLFPIGPIIKNELIAACHQAKTRWSICSDLDDYLTELSGVRGNVLPPLRRVDDVSPSRVCQDNTTRDAVYFGGLNSIEIAGMLNSCAMAVRGLGGELRVYGAVSPKVMGSQAWKHRHFIHCGFYDDRSTFLAKCRNKYKFLFLPFTYDGETMAYSFPSKLIDYTLCGLPIVVLVPGRSALGTWCRNNPASVLFVENDIDDDVTGILHAKIEILLNSLDLQTALAAGAVSAGESAFSFGHHWERFAAALSHDGQTQCTHD
jgi:hypothetical protein